MMLTRELEGHFENLLWTLLQYRKFFQGQPMEVYAREALKSLDVIEFQLMLLKMIDNTMYETMAEKRHVIDIRDVLDLPAGKRTILLLPNKFKDKNDPNSIS